MKAIHLRAPAALDQLQLCDDTDPGAPGPGEIRVRLHASSLNFHDYAVVIGAMPTADGRIPMSDGAGVVEAVGPATGSMAMPAKRWSGRRTASPAPRRASAMPKPPP